MSRILTFSNLSPASILTLLMVPTLFSIGPRAAIGQSAWYEGFEQMTPTWQYLGGDVRLTVRQCERTPQIRHTGERSEWIRIVGDGGTHVYFSHDVSQPRVIDELVPTVQIRADRPGIQLLAELSLPRTKHPQSGQPLTTLVRGTSYSTPGRWQQLRIDGLPNLLASQTRILRNEFGPTVDPREAYISRIVLNVYGAPGETNVWIDDLDIAGYVDSRQGPAPPAPESVTESVPPSPGQWQGTTFPTPDTDFQRRIRLDRSVLLVDGRPLFVRAVRWRGEPLTAIKLLGFNTIWLDRFPTTELLAEADRTGMWLISPAPALPQPPSPDETPTSPPIIGPEYRSVLAWDLGEGLGHRQAEDVRLWAERVRAADSRFRRPLIARPESSLKAYSRIADILVIGRPALGSSMELNDYVQWLRLRPQLARPGTPIWVVVPTGPEPALLAQWQGMSPAGPTTAGFTSEQLRLITYLSSIHGARGLLFESHTPIDATNRSGEVRRATLELLNLELTLSEPWFAGGTFVAMAESSDPDISAAVLRTDRARLVLPIWTGRGAGQVPSPSAQRTVSLVVPGVPEADRAYEMMPGRLLHVDRKRVTGGTRITIDQFALTAQVLVTQDPLAHNSRSRQAAQIGRRAAELQRRLAELKMEQFESLLVPLTLSAPNTPQLKALEKDMATLRRAARESLQKCDEALAGQSYATAYLAAEEAMRPFLLLQREHWLAASQSVTGAAASPMLATFDTLPGHWTLLRGISPGTPRANLLPGGDFENLQTWLGAGWEHFQHPVPGVLGQANLAPEAARSGTLGLRLATTAANAEQVPQIVETSPVWIASAPVNLEARSLVAIRGWVRIPKPIEGSADGLLVIDSLTGRTLAERILATEDWQEFVLYRVCPRSGPLRVTFAMSGIGTAYVDDVTVEILAATAPPVSARAHHPPAIAQ